MNWYRSSYCADATCVEVAKIGQEVVALRDSKRPEQAFLRFERSVWAEFIDGVKAGGFGGR
ncbi:DUF397 domain-containing protein [Actinoplanes sp. NPDC049118]|uniref:DUF397 domain-containing protein n=1 Tax=Actinoplanes sp. NPDC049118 TaxID=3155769 RepID=UPI0033DED2EB